MPIHRYITETVRRAGLGWRFDLLALLVYVAIALALTWPALSGSASLIPEGFLDRDLFLGPPAAERAKLRPAEDPAPVVIELGRERAVSAGLRQGRLDTWTPLVGGGAPLWAESGGPFFPTKLISYLLPGHSGYMLGLTARLLLAALGMYALALSLGMPRGAALMSGALLECSGAFVSNLGYVSSSAGFMLPWALYCAQRLAADQNLRAMGAAAVVLGVTAHGNHPSYILFVSSGFGVWLAMAILQRALQGLDWVRAVPMSLGAGVLAVLVSSAAMLPFLELVTQGFSYKDAEVAEGIWRERLGWTRSVFALALLHPGLLSAAQGGMSFHLWPWAQGASIGVVALALALAGSPALRRHWALAAVLALGVGLTLAPWGLHWLHRLPGLRIVLPWYCFPLIAVPLCLMAGFGLASIVDHPVGPRRMLVPFVLISGSLALTLLSISERGWFVKRFAVAWFKVDFTALREFQAFLFEPVSLVSAAALALVWLALMPLRTKPAALAAVVALVAVTEAILVRAPIVAFERSRALTQPASPLVDELQSRLAGGSWRFVGFPPRQTAEPNAALLLGLRDLRSFHALAVKRHVQFLELTGRQADSPWRYPQWQYPTSLNIPVLSLAGVRYVVLAKECLSSDCRPTGLELLRTGDQVALYENTHALPRFRIAHDVITVQDPEQAARALRRLVAEGSSASERSWRDTVVVETESTGSPSASADALSGQRDSEWVRRVAEPNPQTIVIEAQMNSPGYLVVADTWYPGWTATVNGQEVPVRPANLQFRAVALPAGRHEVVLSYRPWTVTAGYAMSSVGLLAALLAWLWPAQIPAQLRRDRA